MYKRNERAFEHDVTRFLIRNDLKTCKGPIWQNQNVSIFQLFLAVHERGGYTQVNMWCKQRYCNSIVFIAWKVFRAKLNVHMKSYFV